MFVKLPASADFVTRIDIQIPLDGTIGPGVRVGQDCYFIPSRAIQSTIKSAAVWM